MQNCNYQPRTKNSSESEKQTKNNEQPKMTIVYIQKKKKYLTAQNWWTIQDRQSKTAKTRPNLRKGKTDNQKWSKAQNYCTKSGCD